MKKFTALFLALSVLLSLAGCSIDLGSLGDNLQYSTTPTGIAASYDGTLRSLIPEVRKLDLDGGDWTETNGYGYLVLTDVSYDDFDYVRTKVLPEEGYYSDDMMELYTADGTEVELFDHSAYDYATGQNFYLRLAYCKDNQTLAFIVGDIPHSHYCAPMVGVPREELLDEVHLERDVEPYTPAGISFDLQYSHVSYNSRVRTMLMRDIPLEQAEEYITAAETFGYVQSRREAMAEAPEDSLIYEASLVVDAELDERVYLQLAWYDSIILIQVCSDRYLETDEYLWEKVTTFDGSENGHDPYAAPEGGYPVLDLSAADIQTIGNGTVYILEYVEYIQSVLMYCDALEEQGYSGNLLYGADNPTDGISRVFESYCLEGMGNESYINVLFFNGKVMITKSAEPFEADEAELWNIMNVFARIGLSHLQANLPSLGMPVYVGSGNGMETAGVAYCYSRFATVEDFNRVVGKVQNLGYTNVVPQSGDGSVLEYHAYKEVQISKWIYYVYCHVFLDGDFIELQLSFSEEASMHND